MRKIKLITKLSRRTSLSCYLSAGTTFQKEKEWSTRKKLISWSRKSRLSSYNKYRKRSWRRESRCKIRSSNSKRDNWKCKVKSLPSQSLPLLLLPVWAVAQAVAAILPAAANLLQVTFPLKILLKILPIRLHWSNLWYPWMKVVIALDWTCEILYFIHRLVS